MKAAWSAHCPAPSTSGRLLTRLLQPCSGVFDQPGIGCSACSGIGDRHAPEQAFGMLRNRRSACSGTGVRLGPERVFGMARNTQHGEPHGPHHQNGAHRKQVRASVHGQVSHLLRGEVGRLALDDGGAGAGGDAPRYPVWRRWAASDARISNVIRIAPGPGRVPGKETLGRALTPAGLRNAHRNWPPAGRAFGRSGAFWAGGNAQLLALEVRLSVRAWLGRLLRVCGDGGVALVASPEVGMARGATAHPLPAPGVDGLLPRPRTTRRRLLPRQQERGDGSVFRYLLAPFGHGEQVFRLERHVGAVRPSNDDNLVS